MASSMAIHVVECVCTASTSFLTRHLRPDVILNARGHVPEDRPCFHAKRKQSAAKRTRRPDTGAMGMGVPPHNGGKERIVFLDEEHFYQELVALRRRRALADVDVSKRLGTALRTLCGIVAADDDSAVVRKVSATVTELAQSLPSDARTAALIALGLRDGFDQPMYGQRVAAAKQLFDREEKAVRRRFDEGLRLLARQAAQAVEPRPTRVATGHADTRWRTESLYAVLSLEPPVPEAFERRTVVALADGLTELDLAISVPSESSKARPGHAEKLVVDVFRGGTLARQIMESSDRVGLTLRLPRPLSVGERHDVTLRYRAQLQYPHYACTPRYPCDRFDISVRFGRARPSAVYLLDAGFQDDARDAAASGTEMQVDAAGEVHATFENLLPGFTYGMRWSAVPPASIERRARNAVLS